MNIYLTTVMAVISLFTLAVRIFAKDYALKSKFSMATLSILSILTIIQAITSKISRVSIAWWLLFAIFVVLMINTCMSYSTWTKEQKVEEEVDKPEAEDTAEGKEEEKAKEEVVKE